MNVGDGVSSNFMSWAQQHLTAAFHHGDLGTQDVPILDELRRWQGSKDQGIGRAGADHIATVIVEGNRGNARSRASLGLFTIDSGGHRIALLALALKVFDRHQELRRLNTVGVHVFHRVSQNTGALGECSLSARCNVSLPRSRPCPPRPGRDRGNGASHVPTHRDRRGHSHTSRF